MTLVDHNGLYTNLWQLMSYSWFRSIGLLNSVQVILHNVGLFLPYLVKW